MHSSVRYAGSVLVLGVLSACGSGPGGASGPVATQLAFVVEPGTIVVHGSFSPPVAVELEDASGVRVNGSTANILLHLKSGGGNGGLTGIINRAAIGGVATFTDLSIDQEGDYTLVAVSDGVDSAFSAPFTVDPLPPPPSTLEIQVGTVAGGNRYRSVRNGSLNPAVDTLAIGGTATWSWLGGNHGVQSTGVPSFVSSATSDSVGNEYILQFNTAGLYGYNCSVHGDAMTGRILVR